MTQQQIEEGNNLISEFIGEVTTNSQDWIASDKRLVGAYKYHSSWSWLMPVVEKIEQISQDDFTPFAVNIECAECAIWDYADISTIAVEEGETKIEATFKAIVEFLKWHKQKATT